MKTKLFLIVFLAVLLTATASITGIQLHDSITISYILHRAILQVYHDVLTLIGAANGVDAGSECEELNPGIFDSCLLIENCKRWCKREHGDAAEIFCKGIQCGCRFPC
ncbi:hypothetical protein CDL15_Pgr006743 [Punica granatum]|uniref:Uncharacterized protein n=1 Tax=Punica granatum TaxID=22663 RepID=A0A218X711_PUNGR|nr:hypothetical protein CDL15_Pgr006743 [Punica granatum]